MYFLIFNFILFTEIVYSSLYNWWKSEPYNIYIYISSKSEFHLELDTASF